MKIDQATRNYEQWLGSQIPLVRADLRLKHLLMKQSSFAFLRATFYRWMQVWREACADVATAPVLRAIGDLHVENFGTWRDSEGRLIWGINDFDEAFSLPYTNDLVRLAVSARLAISAKHLISRPKNAYDAILTGYMEGLKSGGRPFVLSEQHPWLRDIATSSLRDPIRFWTKMKALPILQGSIPHAARVALERGMPEVGLSYSLRRRVSGLGSLGRPRFVALTEWRGGMIAREVKALVPSASLWARSGQGNHEILYPMMLKHAVRCRDPFVRVEGTWLLRRLSPYCSRIELAALPRKRDEDHLLYAMGWETANIHLGDHKRIQGIRRDLAKRKGKWLMKAAKTMTRATLTDWHDWAKRHR